MKKILIVLCVVALTACSVVGVSAQENLISEYQEAYSTIEYDNPSNFEVVIPETINANDNILQFTALHMNLYDNQIVEVISKTGNTIELSSETTEDKANYFLKPYENDVLARFTKGELNSSISLYPYVENAREIAAAHYTGTATFTIRLTEQP